MFKTISAEKKKAWGHWLLSAPTILFAVTLLVHYLPGWAESLEFNRGAILEGQFWRLLTGNWTHWSDSHLLWDLLMFTALGAIIFRQDPRAYTVLTISAAFLVAITVWVFSPQIEAYRGLSGIDCAFYAYLVTRFTLTATRKQQWNLLAVGLVLQFLVIGKTVFELVSGGTLFVESSNFVPLVSTHLAGLVVGTLIVIINALGSGTEPPADARSDENGIGSEEDLRQGGFRAGLNRACKSLEVQGV